MGFFIVALALMAMFSTASAASETWKREIQDTCQELTFDTNSCALLGDFLSSATDGWVQASCDYKYSYLNCNGRGIENSIMEKIDTYKTTYCDNTVDWLDFEVGCEIDESNPVTPGIPGTPPTGFTEVAHGYCTGPFHDTGSKSIGSVSGIQECYEKCSQIDNYNAVGIYIWDNQCSCSDGCLCWNIAPSFSTITSWVSDTVTVPTVSCDNYIEPGSFLFEATQYSDDACQSKTIFGGPESILFDFCYTNSRSKWTCNDDNTLTITEYEGDGALSGECRGITTNNTFSNGVCAERLYFGPSKLTWPGDCSDVQGSDVEGSDVQNSTVQGSDVQALPIALLFALCLMFVF